jgi:hypothetical protein
LLTFDGAGNVAGSATAVQPDTSPNATTVQVLAQPATRKYIVNADGTGTITLQLPGVRVTIWFVITDGGSGLMFVANGGGNNAATGTARKQ